MKIKQITSLLLIIVSVMFFMFSCADITSEEIDDDIRGDNRNDNRADDVFGLGDGATGLAVERDTTKLPCKGDGYIIYSHDDCDNTDKNVLLDSKVSLDSVSSTATSLRTVKNPVDILFLLDTSNSMYPYLNGKFQRRFKTFISIINDLDWRMFFTNTAYSSSWWGRNINGAMNGQAMRLEGRYDVLNNRYLDRNLPYYSNVFMWTITRDPNRDRSSIDGKEPHNECAYPPYCQSFIKRPLSALKASFSVNKKLTRKEAHFVAVIITNSDEDKDKAIKAKEVVSEFKKVYGSNKRLTVFSLVVRPSDTKCKKENDGIFQVPNYAVLTSDLAKQVGGGNFSLCLDDYSKVAEAIVFLTK